MANGQEINRGGLAVSPSKDLNKFHGQFGSMLDDIDVDVKRFADILKMDGELCQIISRRLEDVFPTMKEEDRVDAILLTSFYTLKNLILAVSDDQSLDHPDNLFHWHQLRVRYSRLQ